MSITFKNTVSEDVFSLTNFIGKEAVISIVEYQFCFNFKDFQTKLVLEAELFDFKNLLNGLVYLNENLKGGFYFEPIISGQIKIKFDINDQGHIIVDGKVYDSHYSIALSFNFTTDQSFLNKYISQCKEVLNFLTQDNNKE